MVFREKKKKEGDKWWGGGGGGGGGGEGGPHLEKEVNKRERGNKRKRETQRECV